MTTLVIDASVAIKWVVQERGTEAALGLLSHQLIAPDLITSECANILWKKVRRGEMSPPEAEMAARLLERADVDILPTRRLMEAATRLAIVLDHPAYDCIYLALAQAQSCRFVTADVRLCRKVETANVGVSIASLDQVQNQL